MKILEAPEIIVDGHTKKGEKRVAGVFRTKEEIFRQYDDKVDEVSYNYSYTVTCL